MKAHFVMFARYNQWANVRLYQMASAVSNEAYQRNIGMYFKSLHGTLNHILVADRVWMKRLTSTGDHPETLDAILYDDFQSLHAARQSEDRRIIDFVEKMTEAALEGDLDYRTLNGSPQKQPVREVLAHVFNHQTHHRGQAHAALTVLGVAEPDQLDLAIMLRELRGRQ